MKHSVSLALALAGLLCLSSTGFGQDDRFTIRLDSPAVEDGGTVSGSAGSTIRIPMDLFLDATVGGTDPGSVQDGEAGVAGSVNPIAGTGASIAFFKDPDHPAFCDANCANDLDTIEGNLFFYDESIVDPTKEPDQGPLQGTGPQGPGIIIGLTTNILSMWDYPAGTFKIGEFEIEITIPEAPETVELFPKDGLQAVGTSKNLTVTFESASRLPTFQGLSFTAQPTEGGSIPGDTESDGDLDTMDVIEYLDFYFLGDPDSLPCGDGSVNDAGNISLLDSNGDGELDISDAIYSLRSQFLDGPPHTLGEACTQISGCPESCEI